MRMVLANYYREITKFNLVKLKLWFYEFDARYFQELHIGPPYYTVGGERQRTGVATHA